jgi:hypothetical protein
VVGGIVIAEGRGRRCWSTTTSTDTPGVSVAVANPDLLAALLPLLREAGFDIGSSESSGR